MLLSCIAAALVFLAAAGVSDVPVWLMASTIAFWAAIMGTLVWQRWFANRPAFEAFKPVPLARRLDPPAL